MVKLSFFLLVTCLALLGASAENGVLLSSFQVSTHVNSRLAKTEISMVFENLDDCSAIHTLTLQLPKNARITDLVMDLSDGCQLESEVKNLEVAINDFENFSSEGKPAALLTAFDMSNYKLQVSIPPNGTTASLMQYEELLTQKLDQVSFQVPAYPGIPVGDLTIDISVEEPNNGIVEFFANDLAENEPFEIVSEGTMASAHYETRDVTENSVLPQLFKAYFKPGPLPENGLFLSDGECFTHLFNPTSFLSSVGPMARKIVFVIDVSGSMSGRKLEDAKASFAVMIDSLDERDTLIVQAFSSKGTESLWGPKAATTSNKADAKQFVTKLNTIAGTNLNAAYLDGIANVYDVPETVAPVVVILSDGNGSSDKKTIARNIRVKNEGKKVKIFSLAFGAGADFDLLLAIAIQNGGRAVRIYEGFGDAISQMEIFYRQELGSILMSNIEVSYSGIEVMESTAPQFPVLAGGSEILVRGKLESANALQAERTLTTVVSANLASGPKEWPIDHIVVTPDGKPDGGSSVTSDCRQSFAQARIAELLEYRDAERALGDELFAPIAMSRSAGQAGLSFEEEARAIAIDARLVWPGLTALVTVENSACLLKSTDVCYSGDGDGSSGQESDQAADYVNNVLDSGSGVSLSGSGSGSSVSFTSSGVRGGYLTIFGLTSMVSTISVCLIDFVI